MQLLTELVCSTNHFGSLLSNSTPYLNVKAILSRFGQELVVFPHLSRSSPYCMKVMSAKSFRIPLIPRGPTPFLRHLLAAAEGAPESSTGQSTLPACIFCGIPEVGEGFFLHQPLRLLCCRYYYLGLETGDCDTRCVIGTLCLIGQYPFSFSLLRISLVLDV